MLQTLKEAIPNNTKRKLSRMARNVRDTLRYRLRKSRTPKLTRARHVVVVCKGNICRSPFAEQFLRNRSGTGLMVESCGLDVNQGHTSPLTAVRVARGFGVELGRHRSRPMAACDLPGADLILAMEFEQYRRLVVAYPQKTEAIHLLRTFTPGFAGLLCNIDDPYGAGWPDYHHCYRLMQKALEGVLGRMS